MPGLTQLYQRLRTNTNDDIEFRKTAQGLLDMLHTIESLYHDAMKVKLEDPEKIEETRRLIEEWDKEINLAEKDLRRGILVAVTGLESGMGNIARYMNLMRIVNDAERIGDYTKNIFRILSRKPDLLSGDDLALFERHKEWLLQVFPRIYTAWKYDDHASAERMYHEASRQAKECDAILFGLMDDPSRHPSPAALALLFRHQKRLLRHIANIATFIYMPYREDNPFEAH